MCKINIFPFLKLLFIRKIFLAGVVKWPKLKRRKIIVHENIIPVNLAKVDQLTPPVQYFHDEQQPQQQKRLEFHDQ